MLQPSTLFTEEIRIYQEHILNYGYCPFCNRNLAQGENVYAGERADGYISVACESCKDMISTYVKKIVYHPKEYDVPNRNVPLWRYQDFPKFVSLLDCGELFFTRADKFEDVFEGARGFNFQKEAIYDKLKPSLTLKVKSQLRAAGIENPTDDEVDKKLIEETEAFDRMLAEGKAKREKERKQNGKAKYIP